MKKAGTHVPTNSGFLSAASCRPMYAILRLVGRDSSDLYRYARYVLCSFQMNRNAKLPKYMLIAKQIIDAIRSGDLKPGMKIPSENEIIRVYGVSNTTARKALGFLEAEGWGIRVKGKATYVQQKNVLRTVNRILSFTKNMTEAGYVPMTHVLFRGVEKDGYSAIINGRKYTMKGPVYRIRRLRYGSEIPMLLEERYINLDLCPGITESDLSASLYDLYEQEFNLEMKEIRQMISAIAADEEIERIFGMPKHTPCLLLEGVTFVAKEIILEMEKSIYRGDKYKFALSAT